MADNTATGKPMPVQLFIAQLTMMVEGRPFEWSDGVLTVFHEDGCRQIDINLSADDLADYDRTRDLIIKPAVYQLDRAAFPERTDRFMAACRVYASSCS